MKTDNQQINIIQENRNKNRACIYLTAGKFGQQWRILPANLGIKAAKELLLNVRKLQRSLQSRMQLAIIYIINIINAHYF